MSSVAAEVRSSNYFRGNDRIDAKEWYHFCIFADAFELIVNLGWLQHGRGKRPFLTILVRRAGGPWSGTLQPCQLQTDNAPGLVALESEAFHFAWQQNHYELTFASEIAEGQITLTPVTAPFVARSPMGNGEDIEWCVTPRLTANGCVNVHAETLQLEEAPAYHDHNWGRFAWGGDHSWDWCCFLPHASDLSVVVASVRDRAGDKAHFQELYLWRGSNLVGVFDGFELECRGKSAGVSCRVPGVYNLIGPMGVHDCPSEVSFRIREGDTDLRFLFELGDGAEIWAPSDHGLGDVVFSEISAAGSVSGTLRGESIDAEGPGIWEFNRVRR